MAVINFGSLNVDYVYRLPEVVQPGQTLAALGREMFAGGKGLNQSVALARAGVSVQHIGRIGADGGWLRDTLAEAGVDVSGVAVCPTHATGHAVVQVSAQGENAIIVYGGANRHLELAQVGQGLKQAGPGDWVLLQNETNALPAIVATAKAKGASVCYNPSPTNEDALEVSLDQVDLLVVNLSEARALAGDQAADPDSPDALIHAIQAMGPDHVVLTLGALGALHFDGINYEHAAPPGVKASDTTAAGDCFLGYFLAGVVDGLGAQANLERACAAAALSATRAGACGSIPKPQEVTSLMQPVR